MVQPKIPPPPVDNNGRMRSNRGHNRCKIVLDSGAFINIFYNRYLIEYIQFLDNPHEVTTRGCIKMKYNQVGSLYSLLRHLLLPMDEYYFHASAVANVVSLGRISKEFKTVFDSGIHNTFYVFNDDGTYVVLNKAKNNLYRLSVYDGGEYDCCCITTVAGTEFEISELNWRRAETVRSLQKRIGFIELGPNKHGMFNVDNSNTSGGNFMINNKGMDDKIAAEKEIDIANKNDDDTSHDIL